MAGPTPRWIVVPVALGALTVGAVAGWWAARRGAPVEGPAPPPVLRTPFHDAVRGEVLVLRHATGQREEYRVLETSPETVLLEMQRTGDQVPTVREQWRVTRNWFGNFQYLQGDMDPERAAAAMRDLVVVSATPERRDVAGRTLDCWRLDCTHRVQGALRIWISPEVPVHGVVRIETSRFTIEAESFSFPP